MREPRRRLTRADLPEVLTPEAIRALPLGELQRLARPGNGVLSAEEQEAFDSVIHEVMSEAAQRVRQQMSRGDWAAVRRDAAKRRPGRGGRPSDLDAYLDRLAKRIDQQADVAASLAPGVDWSFAQSEDEPTEAPKPEESTDDDDGKGSGDTVSDLEQYLSEQVELVQVMTEMAEISKRTYALEQQRDLQNTRGVFFAFVVSVAVLVAGWAPLVAAEDWDERLWIIGLSLVTCAVAGAVYALVRRYQTRHQPDQDDDAAD